MKLGNILGGAGRCLIAVASIAPVFAASCTERFGANCGDLRGCTGQGGESSEAPGGEGSSSEGSGATNGAGSSSGGAGGEGTTIPCADDVATDAACWTNNAYAVFVSNVTGDDETGDGTKEAPFATIMRGVGAAAGKKIFVCSGARGPYVETLSFDGAEAVAMHGGFVCGTWDYTKTIKAHTESPDDVGLRISKSNNIVIEDFVIAAAPGRAGYDASSYGAFVTDSTAVLLRRVELVAGDGAAGSDGEPGEKGVDAAEPGSKQDGRVGNCESSATYGGSWPATPVCGGTRGGDGGDRSLGGSGDGFSGVPSTQVTPPDQANGGSGHVGSTKSANPGKPGSTGNDGEMGPVAGHEASFSRAGYVVADGNPGTDGFPGQGGGGGADAAICTGAGAGGMGGCGGGAGTGGLGGGASIALYSSSSNVLLVACTLRSGAGGVGGAGGDGGGSGLGGKGGTGARISGSSATSGDGGPGGNGGRGGSGSGGTGGPSYALVFSGAQPDFTEDTQLVPGQGGVGGLGGQVDGSAPRAPSGAAGDSAAVFEVEERM